MNKFFRGWFLFHQRGSSSLNGWWVPEVTFGHRKQQNDTLSTRRRRYEILRSPNRPHQLCHMTQITVCVSGSALDKRSWRKPTVCTAFTHWTRTREHTAMTPAPLTPAVTPVLLSDMDWTLNSPVCLNEPMWEHSRKTSEDFKETDTEWKRIWFSQSSYVKGKLLEMFGLSVWSNFQSCHILKTAQMFFPSASLIHEFFASTITKQAPPLTPWGEDNTSSPRQLLKKEVWNHGCSIQVILFYLWWFSTFYFTDHSGSTGVMSILGGAQNGREVGLAMISSSGVRDLSPWRHDNGGSCRLPEKRRRPRRRSTPSVQDGEVNDSLRQQSGGSLLSWGDKEREETTETLVHRNENSDVGPPVSPERLLRITKDNRKGAEFISSNLKSLQFEFP